MPLDARTMSSRRVSWPVQQLDSPRVRHEVGNSDLRQAVCPFIGPPHLLAPKFTSVPASFAEQNSAKTGANDNCEQFVAASSLGSRIGTSGLRILQP